MFYAIWRLYLTVGTWWMQIMVHLGGTNMDGTMNLWGALLMYLFQGITIVVAFVVIMTIVLVPFFFVLDTFIFESDTTNTFWYQLKCNTFVKCY